MKERPIWMRTFTLLWLVLLTAGCGNKAAPSATLPNPAGAVASYSATRGGDLAALGTIRPARVLQLGFPVGASLSAVHVQIGAQVQEGEILAELDSAALELELQNAQELVKIYQAQLAQFLNDPQAGLIERAESEHAQEVAQAQVTLRLARGRLQQAQEAAAVAAETARLNLEIAANALREAQDAYSRVYWQNENLRQRGIELTPDQQGGETSTWRRAEDAEAAMEQARLAYAQATSTTTLALHEAEVDLARLQLQGLLDWENPHLEPIPSEQVAQARARLRQAELVVAQLELQLQHTVLRAPFAGVVSAVYLHPGEWAATGAPALEIVDIGRWYVETRNVSELDIGRLRVGQEALVHVNAFGGSELTGRVMAICPVAVVQQGDTTYTLRIELDPTELKLWPGMTVQVEIVLNAD